MDEGQARDARFRWIFWRFAWLSRPITEYRWRRLFWRLYWRMSKPPLDDSCPSTDRPCEWCEKVAPTKVRVIWSGAFPEGHLAQLCERCASGCAD